MESQTLRSLTKEVLFLVALATAKRVGELQGLSNVVSSLGEDFVVSYLPFFLAKLNLDLTLFPDLLSSNLWQILLSVWKRDLFFVL